MYKGSKQRGIRISRPCYDKYHHCPGWAGGGMKYAKATLCNGGCVTVNYSRRGWELMPHRCAKCHVIVLPFKIRYIDPGYVKYFPDDLKGAISNKYLLLKYKLKGWRVS